MIIMRQNIDTKMQRSLVLFLFLTTACSEYIQPGHQSNLTLENGCVNDCMGIDHGTYQSCRGCEFYVNCSDEGTIEKKCGARKVWSQKEGRCIHSTGTCSIENCVKDCKGLAHTHYQSCRGCNYHVQCDDAGNLYDHNCSASAMLVWDDVKKTCKKNSFTCSFEIGTNECDSCSDNAMCTNTDGSQMCACMEGFTGEGYNCTDINECENKTHSCSDNATCINNNGSFTCNCTEGFTADGFSCFDINECEDNTHSCSDNATCINNNGSFTCNCTEGFTADGVSCFDINECEDNTHSCSDNATCINNNGSYTCNCTGGFTADGVSCFDTNECAVGNGNCSDHALCINNPGNYSCKCEEGFTGNGFSCTDINECVNGSHGCSPDANCTNMSGTNDCECNDGFQGNGVLCLPDAPEDRVIFNVTLRFANMTWRVEHSNVSSDVFHSLERLLAKGIGQTFVEMENYRGIRLLSATEGSLITNFDTIFGIRSKDLSEEDIADTIKSNMNGIWDLDLGIDPKHIIVHKEIIYVVDNYSKYSSRTLLLISVVGAGTVLLACTAFLLVTLYHRGRTRDFNDSRHVPRNRSRRFRPAFPPWEHPPPYPYPDRPPPYPGDSPQDSQWSWLDQGAPRFHTRVAASVPGPNAHNAAPQAPATYIDVVSSGLPQHPGFDPVQPATFPNQNDSEGTTTASPVYVDNIDLFSDPLSGVDQQPPTVDQRVQAWTCNAQDPDSRPSTNSDTYEALQQHQWNPAIPRPMDRGKIIDRVKDGLRNWFATISSRSNVPARRQINTRGAATGVSRGANNFEMENIPSGEITYATSFPQPQPDPQLQSHKARLPRHHFGPESTRHNMNYISPDPKRRYNGLLRHPGGPRGRINGPSGFNSRHITPMARLRVSAEISFNRNFRPYHRPR